MSLVTMHRAPIGKVFGGLKVQKVDDKTGKPVVDKDGKPVMGNALIAFEGLAEDSTQDEVDAAYKGDAESIRKALIRDYNEQAFNAVRDPFTAAIPDSLTDEQAEAVKLSAKQFSTLLHKTPAEAVNMVLAAMGL